MSEHLSRKISNFSLIRRYLSKALIGVGSFVFSCVVLANPVVDNVAAGRFPSNKTIRPPPLINPAKKASSIKSFNINKQEATHFNQPAGGVTLNRINPNQGASSIYGTLTATGRIILVNPAGVYFGPSAFVNVGGLIATTANITDQNFLNGIYKFSKVAGFRGSVINEGTIIAAQNGLVALVAPSVINKGLIQANVGKVVLASGEAYTMSFDADKLISFSIDTPTTSRAVDQNGQELSVGVKNAGTIIANGGTIMLTAKAAAGVLDQAINMEGIAQARSVGVHNGEVFYLLMLNLRVTISFVSQAS